MNEINEDEEPIASISEKTECLICLEGFEESNGTKLPCGHFCCENCLFNYLKTEIESAKVAKIQCFQKGCDFILSEGIQNLLINTKYLKKEPIFSLIKTKNFVLNQTAIVISKKGKINTFNVRTDINTVTSV